MKFIDLYGKEHSKDIDYRKYTRSRDSRSNIANYLYDKIVEIFPNQQILEEFPCVGIKPALYIDFMILSSALRIAFEADGRQHKEYVPFFHGSRMGFVKAQLNDINKDRWTEINDIKLIRVSSEKEVDDILERINE